MLVAVVLMQASQGGGLSGMGGGQTNAIFGGRSAGSALSKFTTYLAVAFMGLALLISLIGSSNNSPMDSVIEKAQQDGILTPTSEDLSLPTLPIIE